MRRGGCIEEAQILTLIDRIIVIARTDGMTCMEKEG